MKKIMLIVGTIVLVSLIILIFWVNKEPDYFKLKNIDGSRIKAEEIQAIHGTIRVMGDTDMDVIFTDVETGQIYKIGYITHGWVEKIELDKGHWYKVEANGNIELSGVNIRIE